MCLPCPVGHSCLDATQPPVLCQPGSFSLDGKGPCTHCPKGYKCATTTDAPVQCVDGTYSPVDAVDCLECPAGKYCPQPSSDPISCSVGYYSVIGSTACIPCPAGMECASPSSIPVECPSGTYTPGPASSCLPCPSGSACANATATPTVYSCHPGFFCIGGAAVPTQMETPAGSYSLIGATAPSPCPPGQYNLYPAQDKCLVCPAGFYCSLPGTVSPTVCPTGNYCPQGTSLPVKCLPGTFADVQGLVKIDQCEPCPSGQYCDSYGLSAPSGPCLAGFVCVGGSPISNPVAQIYGDICPVASYCPEGTGNAISCPAGSFRDAAGGTSLASCSLCPGGQHCSATGLTKPSGSCSPGYYCVSG
eukprot:jgi/Phyca11/117719/e_gw1.34.423.1